MQKFLLKAFYKPNSKYFKKVNNFLAAITLISIASVSLETVESFNTYKHIFNWIQFLTIHIFTLEYIGRIIAKNKKPLEYIFSFFGMIDLLAIIPTYLNLTNLTFLKSARILRILRFLRILRIAKTARLKPETINKEEEDFFHSYKIKIYFFSLFASILIFGSLIYVIESPNPEFANTPLSMIWSAKVLLGGVPQITPTTIFGDVVIILTRFVGLLLFGLLSCQ